MCLCAAIRGRRDGDGFSGMFNGFCVPLCCVLMVGQLYVARCYKREEVVQIMGTLGKNASFKRRYEYFVRIA